LKCSCDGKKNNGLLSVREDKPPKLKCKHCSNGIVDSSSIDGWSCNFCGKAWK
jgi:ribosomal protein L37AE/L43A